MAIEEYYKKEYQNKLDSQLIYLITNFWREGYLNSSIEEIDILIKKGACVNSGCYLNSYNDDKVSLLLYVSSRLNSNDYEIGSFYFKVAELLILNGASINEKIEDKLYSKDTMEYKNDEFQFTPFDYIIIRGGDCGLNLDTYRLAKITITSLSKKDMNKYLFHHKKDETILGLTNILKEFGKFEQHLEYLI